MTIIFKIMFSASFLWHLSKMKLSPPFHCLVISHFLTAIETMHLWKIVFTFFPQ